jgi:dihydrofolate reductase
MSKIKLFIATTLDGYIAREDGSLDWLYAFPNPNNTDYGYADFFETIDTVIIGRKTYQEILSFGVDWPYANCNTYMVTSDKNYQPKTEKTSILSNLSMEKIESIKEYSKKNIWIVGGGKIITQFLNLGQIDEMILCVIPKILGKGIELFPDSPKETSFDLLNVETFESGAVNLTYQKSKEIHV